MASHTWDHEVLTGLRPEEIREELQHPDEEMARLTGRRPTPMRSPQGRTNGTVHEICRELGLSEVLWSVTAKDCLTTASDLITRRVLAESSRDGITLPHDICDGTMPAVPGIIDALKERGHVFVTVPQSPVPGKAEPGRCTGAPPPGWGAAAAAPRGTAPAAPCTDSWVPDEDSLRSGCGEHPDRAHGTAPPRRGVAADHAVVAARCGRAVDGGPGDPARADA